MSVSLRSLATLAEVSLTRQDRAAGPGGIERAFQGALSGCRDRPEGEAQK
jgi:hypothetical protein